MKINFNPKTTITVLLCNLALATSMFAGSPSDSKSASSNRKENSEALPVVHVSDADGMRVAGEQRFRANCARCHAAPQKFPPRMMGTILRHMRVRATITNEDQRLILFYMTQ
ncbi:MAG TPA: cytochrome c [Candidatus Sulfotelmatobacter sp.]